MGKFAVNFLWSGVGGLPIQEQKKIHRLAEVKDKVLEGSPCNRPGILRRNKGVS